jgi:hypothetical protein
MNGSAPCLRITALECGQKEFSSLWMFAQFREQLGPTCDEGFDRGGAPEQEQVVAPKCHELRAGIGDEGEVAGSDCGGDGCSVVVIGSCREVLDAAHR